MSRSVKLALGLLFAVPISAAGQAIGPGFELERSGRYAEAASTYMTTIRADPVNVPALLGLERTLYVLNRMPELLPLVQRARERSPENPALRSLEVRVYAALNEPDSLETVVMRWAATNPRSEVPYAHAIIDDCFSFMQGVPQIDIASADFQFQRGRYSVHYLVTIILLILAVLMKVNEPWGNDESLCIDDCATVQRIAGDRFDRSCRDTHITDRIKARLGIDHTSIHNHDVVGLFCGRERKGRSGECDQ